MLGYIYDRSKNNQGNLILCVCRAADTFMYHNNKDNSIKTPIMDRYRGNILFIYHIPVQEDGVRQQREAKM